MPPRSRVIKGPFTHATWVEKVAFDAQCKSTFIAMQAKNIESNQDTSK